MVWQAISANKKLTGNQPNAALCLSDEICMNNLEKQVDVAKIAQAIFIGFKWLSIFGFLISFCGLALSILGSYSLWFNSSSSIGTIIGYKTVYISHRSTTNSSSSSFGTQLPIVAFTNHNGKNINFDGKFGHNNDRKGKAVPIIFSNTNSQNAIIDLGNLHNWLSTYIWLFCMVASLLGIKRFSKKPNLNVK